MEKYIVASTKEWNKKQFLAFSKKVAGEWRFVGTREELDRTLLQAKPRFIHSNIFRSSPFHIRPTQLLSAQA